MDKDNSLQEEFGPFSKTGLNFVELMLPMVTVSEANGGAKKSTKKNGKTIYQAEHWSEKATRHRKQKSLVAYMLNPHKDKLSLPCLIEFTRYAPKKLDRFDNLPMSLKYVLDSVCEAVTGDYRPGRADDTEEIDVNYKQVISKIYGVRIKITMKKELE